MNIIEQEVKFLPQEPGITGMKKAIEYAARVCYMSMDKITGYSYDDFIKTRILPRGHGRALEFGTCYLKVPDFSDLERKVSVSVSMEKSALRLLLSNPYTKSDYNLADNSWYITTNYRVIMQGFEKEWSTAIEHKYANNIEFMMYKYWCEPTENHFRRYTLQYNGIARAIAAGLRTHTRISTLMQSTRYCLYSSKRFGATVNIAQTEWEKKRNALVNIEQYKDYSKLFNSNESMSREDVYMTVMSLIEDGYMALTGKGEETFLGHPVTGEPFKAEEGRGILGLDVATMLLQCAFVDDWNDLLRQRLAHDAHPDTQHVARLAHNALSEVVVREKIKQHSND